MSNNVTARTIMTVHSAKKTKSFMPGLLCTGQLTQAWNDGAAVPDWTLAGNAGLRPTFKAYAITNKTVTDHQFKWVRVDPEGSDSGEQIIKDWAENTPRDTSLYELTTAGHTQTLVVKGNLASASNIRPDIIRCYMKFNIGGVWEEGTRESVINIVPMSTSGNFMAITASTGTSLSNNNTDTELTAHIYNSEGAEVTDGTYCYEWHAGTHTATPIRTGLGSQNKHKLTVTRSMVDWQQLFICCAYKPGSELNTSTNKYDGERVAQASATISDEADEYAIMTEETQEASDDTSGIVKAHVAHFDKAASEWQKIFPSSGTMDLNMLGIDTASSSSDVIIRGTVNGVYGSTTGVYTFTIPASLYQYAENQAELVFNGTV